MTDEIQEAVDRHELERHPVQLSQKQIEELMTQHHILWDEIRPMAKRTAKIAEDTNEKVTMIGEEMHGKRRPTIADPDRHTGGFVEKIDSMYLKIQNGGVTVKVPKAAWVAIAALITATGAIFVVLLSAMLNSGGVP